MASPGKKSFLLRIDPGVWAEIERLAAQELRSANAQIEYLLRDALARRGRTPRPATDNELDAHSAANGGAPAVPSLGPGEDDGGPT